MNYIGGRGTAVQGFIVIEYSICRALANYSVRIQVSPSRRPSILKPPFLIRKPLVYDTRRYLIDR